MKLIPLLLTIGIAAGCAVRAPVEAPIERAGPIPDAIRAAMQGRVAGQPVACISQIGLRSTRTIAGAMLFRGPGSVIYVNEGPAGCSALALGRSIRTSAPGGRLCRGDIVTAFDPVSGISHGGCVLGDFVPYRRAN